MNNGYIKLYKSITHWEWYADINTARLFIDLLINAEYTDTEWRGIKIKRGEQVTSLSRLSQRTNLSLRQTRDTLNRLKKTSEVTIKTTNKYSVISINNFDLYQQNDKQTVTKKSRKATHLYIKEIKNKRIDKKYSTLLEIGQPEIQQLAQENRISVTTVAKKYQDLVDYCQSKGKTYKNYLAALRSWIRKDIEKGLIKQELNFEERVREENPGATII